MERRAGMPEIAEMADPDPLPEAAEPTPLHGTPVGDLRRGLRDLANLTALDDVWAEAGPEYVARSLVQLLGRTLPLDACLVRLQLDDVPGAVEATWPPEQAHVADALREVSPGTGPIIDPGDRGMLQTITLDHELLGLHSRVVAASSRPEFPTAVESLLIESAANQAAFAVRRGRLLDTERLGRERLQRLLAKAPALILVVTGPDHRVEFANERYLQSVELAAPDGILGRPIREAFPGPAGEIQAELLDRAYAAAGTLTAYEQRFSGVAPDGTLIERFFSFALQPFRDGSGAVEGIFAHAVDVTDQVVGRHAAEAEAQRTRRLQQATAALAAPMTFKEALRAVVGECRQALHASGGWLTIGDGQSGVVRVAHAVGLGARGREHLRDLGSPALAPTVDAIRRKHAVFLESAAAAARFPGLREVWADIGVGAAATVPLSSGGRVLGALTLTFAEGHAFDEGERALLIALATQCAQAIERVQAQESERATREARDAFVGIISHELRTPITTVLAGARILQRDALDAERRRDLVDDMADEAERLNRLVEDLLVLSKVEHRRLEMANEPVQLSHLVASVIESERQRWPQVTFELTPTPGLPPVIGEATYVEQVLRNLLANAAKYGGPGSTVSVGIQQVRERIRVTVLDDGPGLDPGEARRIFELFYRSPSTARARSGAGIGLFVCRALVRAMGGRIWAARRQPTGSRFSFELQVYTDREAG
jgi:signal transduction histidine kinase/PAS domain-containing protein